MKWYNIVKQLHTGTQGWLASSPWKKGGGAMLTVYEALTLMFAFGMLVVALLSNKK